jgi:hypothetical protein
LKTRVQKIVSGEGNTMTQPAAQRDAASPALAANLAKLQPWLARYARDGLAHVINGQLVPSLDGGTFTSESPVDGSLIGKVPRGLAADIDRAAKAASAAFPAWRDLDGRKRRLCAAPRIFASLPIVPKVRVMVSRCRPRRT